MVIHFLALITLLALPGAAQDLSPLPEPAPRQTPASQTAAPELVLEVISVEGFVELRRVGETEWSELVEFPIELNDRDRIHTYNDARVRLRLDDGTELTLGPYAIFSADRKRSDLTVFALGRGRLEAKVSPGGGRRKRRLEIRTPAASAWTVEGELTVDHTSEGRTIVSVRGGEAEVRPKSGQPRGLISGEEVEIVDGSAGKSREAGERPAPKPPRRKVEVVEDRPERAKAWAAPPKAGMPDRVRSRARREVERELGLFMAREAVEASAAMTAKHPVYAEGKVLMDAFGRRARVEEYVSRPDSTSFKLITLNQRAGRNDWAVFEVTANAGLPENLADAGNLWFQRGGAKPGFYAVRERWTVSNGRDSVVRVMVDGDSLAVDIPVRPVYDPVTGQYESQIVSPAYQTVFGNSYEFINGEAAAIDRIWSETGAAAFRPLNNGVVSGSLVGGMAWHAQPIQVDVRDAAVPATRLATYWENAFLSTDPTDATGNATGRTLIEAFDYPASFRGEFRERRFYIDFRDTNGNGIQDFPEITQAGAGCFYGNCAVANVFYDRSNRLNGTALVALPGSGCQGTTAACGTNDGDTVFFSDTNGNGALNAGEASLVGPRTTFDAALLAFAAASPRAWTENRQLLGTDSGEVLDTGGEFSSPVTGESVGALDQVSGLFERFAYQRTLTSSEFSGRSIDLVLTPVIYLKSGLLDPKAVHGEAPAPGGGPISP
mgnify:CR=1 FL=1